MKESQIISNNSNGGYFFLRTNTFSFQKQTKVSRYIIARHVSYNRLTTRLYLDYFQHLDLCVL